MSSNVFRMSPESRIQITAKLPAGLHATLNEAINEGGYQNMTAAIIEALEKELSAPLRMSEDLLNNDGELQRLTLELQKNVSEMAVMHKTFEDSLANVRIQLETENENLKSEIERLNVSLQEAPDRGEFSRLQARSEELEKHNSTLKGELEKAHRDKETTQNLYDNYMRQMQTLIQQKAIEAPGEKKKWWKFW